MADSIRLGARAPLTPIDVQTFSKSADRSRLSGVALKAFRALIEHWGLSNTDAAALLGVSDSTRESAAIGVYKGLHLLFADEMADRWPKLPNRGPIFQRASPVQAMIEGGIPVMLETRRYIDAVRGGL